MSLTLLSSRARTIVRMLMGAASLPDAERRGRGFEPTLISIDVFETLVTRVGEADAAWKEGTLRAAEVARARGMAVPGDPLIRRRGVERGLAGELKRGGKEPEFTHERALRELLKEWGGGAWVNEEAERVAEWELEREIALTAPVEKTREWVREWAKAGKRVVAVSDTRYTSTELGRVLAHHGVTGLAAIYASVDHGASKFAGRLFDVVAAKEGVAPDRTLHVGDDLIRDGFAAAERGLAVRRIRRADRVDGSNGAFAVGYQRLGPVMVAFTRLLFAQARRDGIKRLSFVARDGDLLLDVAHVVAEKDTKPMELRYVHLSRRAVACVSPDLRTLGKDPEAVERVMRSLEDIRGMGTVVESFQSYYGISSEVVTRHAKRLGATGGGAGDLHRILCDAEAAAEISTTMEPMRERLLRYLTQERVLEANTALVDIGWRGSLQKILSAEAKVWGRPAPRGYYVGLWDENGRRFPENACGVIADQRRGRGTKEGAAWHAAFLLEAICRAKHGIVAGFRDEVDGTVQPVHVEEGGTREAERSAERTQDRVREGVMAYARSWAKSGKADIRQEEMLRGEAQRLLYELAFFPNEKERAIGRELIYSEPTSDEAALPLIMDRGTGVRGWIAGLRSPWKGGYLRGNGGRLMARTYCVLEGVLGRLPAGTKSLVRRILAMSRG